MCIRTLVNVRMNAQKFLSHMSTIRFNLVKLMCVSCGFLSFMLSCLYLQRSSLLPDAGHLFVERWLVSRPVWRFCLISIVFLRGKC